MTNKGQKYLIGELAKSEARAKALDRRLNHTMIRNNELHRINKAMESDLLDVCEPHLVKAIISLVKLRKSVKRKLGKRPTAVKRTDQETAPAGTVPVDTIMQRS